MIWDQNQGVLTSYKFNMGTQSPFGYIFIIAITVGALGVCRNNGIHLLAKDFQKS